jgi:WD40 repeat protein
MKHVLFEVKYQKVTFVSRFYVCVCILIIQGNLVAVGTHKGYVQIWDVAATKKINTLEGHSARVGKMFNLICF